jgi:hypothetical protein
MSLHRQLGAYAPEFGYHFVPGLKARVEHRGGGYLVRVNEAGFRSDREFVAEKPPGTFRVLVFGDSFTAGDGVSNGSRYTDVLDKALPDVEVFNYGVPGTGTDEQFLIHRHAAAGVQHDLVVIAVWVENIRRIMMRYRPGLQSATGEMLWMPKAYFELDADGTLRRGNDPVPREPLRSDELSDEERQQMLRVTGLRATRHIPQTVRHAIQKATRYDVLPEYQRPDTDAWRLMSAILRTWTGGLSVPAVVMPIPLGRHVEETASPEHYRARFAELHDPPRVLVHDPLPALLELPLEERQTLRFGTDDDHPTKRYHELLGLQLADVVRRVRSEPMAA